MNEMKWGGRVQGVTDDGSRTYSGVVFGTFVGAVPGDVEHWVAGQLLLEVQAILSAAASPAALGADPAALGRTLTQATHAKLAEQGVSGVVTEVNAKLKETMLEAAPPPAPTGNVDETALGTAAYTGPALPFRNEPAAAPPPAAHAPHEAVGATGFMPPIQGGEPLPFQQNELTVEQYASLCAERALSPGSAAAIAARYRVSNLEALDREWRALLEGDADLHRRWQAAYAQYDAWLRSQR